MGTIRGLMMFSRMQFLLIYISYIYALASSWALSSWWQDGNNKERSTHCVAEERLLLSCVLLYQGVKILPKPTPNRLLLISHRSYWAIYPTPKLIPEKGNETTMTHFKPFGYLMKQNQVYCFDIEKFWTLK